MIMGCIVDGAGNCAARTSGGNPDVMIQGKPVIRVLQNGSEGLKEPSGSVFDVEIFNMIPDGQSLTVKDFRLLRGGKSLLPFLGSQRPCE